MNTTTAIKAKPLPTLRKSSTEPDPSPETTAVVPSKDAIVRSTKIYSAPLTLFIYDFWVLGVVTDFAWRCPATTHLLPFFRAHVGACHLDIGVGTGYYLRHADLPADTAVTLLDLNQDSLDMAAASFDRPTTTTTALHDAFEPLPAALGDFDSVSLFYLLHCLPGSMADKCGIFAHLRTRLRLGGCVYGATILGDGVEHNAFGRLILNFGHWEGFFCNWKDSEAALAKALGLYFDEVETKVVGTVCLFKGSKPKV